MSHSVRVRVQGREYNLRSQQGQDEVQKVADFVEGQLAEITRVASVDSQDALALTLLNLAGKYLSLKESLDSGGPEQEVRLERLLQQLEDGLQALEKD